MTNAVVCSQSLKSKLLKLLPTLASTAEMESIIEADTTLATPLTSELVEKMVDEFMALKNSMNSVELQLYEANEKIAELIESVSCHWLFHVYGQLNEVYCCLCFSFFLRFSLSPLCVATSPGRGK